MCDSTIGTKKDSIRRNAAAGQDFLSSADLWNELKSSHNVMVFGDLSDFKDGLPSTDSLLPNISRYSQFSFEWNHCRNGSFKCTGIRIREQSNLGAGKLVPLDEKVLPYSKLILPVDKDWPEIEYSNQLLSKKSPIPRKERTVNCTNDPFPYKGFKCPEIGC